MPRISVLMPAYNAVATLDDAVESVRAQTFPDWELVVADDGSADDTLARAAAWAGRDGRIRTLHHPEREHRGRPATRNLTVAAARGEIVAFLDADDTLLPHALDTHVAALDGRPEAAVSYGQGAALGGERAGEVMGRGAPDAAVGLLRQLARFNVLVTSATAVRRAALGRDPFSLDMPLCQDWACWLQLARRHRFVFTVEVLCRYRVHAGSGTALMRQGGGEPAYELLQARYLRHALRSGSPRERRSMREGLRFRAAACLLRGLSSLRRGRIGTAARWLQVGCAAAGSPALAASALLAVVPERLRIARGLDPPLTIEPG